LAKDEQQRPRGHSSIGGGVDAQVLAEREEGALASVLTLQKLKDEQSDIRLRVFLARRVIDHDDDREEISTLIVEDIEAIGAAPPREVGQWTPAMRLFHDAVLEALADHGVQRTIGLSGPKVWMVDPQKVRDVFYRRYAAAEGGDKAPHTKRKAFNRKLQEALNKRLICAEQTDGGEFVWLPDGARGPAA
jgi:hypothetical protein